MFVNYNEYFFIIFFSINIISNIANLQDFRINTIMFNQINTNKIFKQNELLCQTKFNNSKSVEIFAGNNNDNSFKSWIEDNMIAFIAIIITIVFVIVIIIVLIFICRKMTKRNKELLKEVNKISFQNDIRDSRPTEESDKLI